MKWATVVDAMTITGGFRGSSKLALPVPAVSHQTVQTEVGPVPTMPMRSQSVSWNTPQVDTDQNCGLGRYESFSIARACRS